MSLLLHSYLIPSWSIGYLLTRILVHQLFQLIKFFTIVVNLFTRRLQCSILGSIIFTLFTHTKYISYSSCCLSCSCVCCLLVTSILIVILSMWLVWSQSIKSIVSYSLHHSLINLWDSLLLALSFTVISVTSIWLLFIGSTYSLLIVFTLRFMLVTHIFINCVTIYLYDNTSYYLPRFMIILVWLGGILVVFVYVAAIVPNRYATPYSLGLMLLLLVITITLSLTLDNVVPSSRLNTIAINTITSGYSLMCSLILLLILLLLGVSQISFILWSPMQIL